MAQAQAPSPSIFTTFFRWLRLKNYQYEVTFALYMLTPAEKFIFNSLLLLIISMFFTAAYVYLPNHIITICSRIWYYWAGEPLATGVVFTSVSASAQDAAATANKRDMFGTDPKEAYDVFVNTMRNVAESATATVKKIAEL